MATRSFLLSGSSIGTSFTVVNTIDGATDLTPPSGIMWTLREIRIDLSAAGEWEILFDTEKYYNGRQELDFVAKGVPIVVSLDIQEPHFIQLKAKADSSTLTCYAELVIEETPTGGAAAP